jgi:hypothetical protein
MQLPQEMRFMELVHAENERIPVDALEFGTTAIQRLVDGSAQPRRVKRSGRSRGRACPSLRLDRLTAVGATSRFASV